MLTRPISIAQNSYFDFNGLQLAEVAELVYALDLGSSAERRESSSLSFRTRLLRGEWLRLSLSLRKDSDAG